MFAGCEPEGYYLLLDDPARAHEPLQMIKLIKLIASLVVSQRFHLV